MLGALQLKGIAKPRTSLRSWGASVTGLSHPVPRRCYASGSESSTTEVEKILLDTIKVCGLVSQRSCTMVRFGGKGVREEEKSA